MTCPVLSHLHVCSHVCMHHALCGLHASHIVWPACTPGRVGGRACACARAICSPALKCGLCPVCAETWIRAFRGPFPACPPACRPSRLSLPSGAARPVALPANRFSFWERVATSWESVAPNLAPQPGICQRRRRHRSLPCPCAGQPSLGPRMSPQAPPTRSRSLAFSGFGQENVFFRFRGHPASSGPSESNHS